MNKKANTFLFLAGATVFNIIVTVVSFFLLIILYVKTLMNRLPEGTQEWAFTLSFIAALIISFFVYRFVIKRLEKKIDMDKYFDPIFSSRRRQR